MKKWILLFLLVPSLAFAAGNKITIDGVANVVSINGSTFTAVNGVIGTGAAPSCSAWCTTQGADCCVYVAGSPIDIFVDPGLYVGQENYYPSTSITPCQIDFYLPTGNLPTAGNCTAYVMTMSGTGILYNTPLCTSATKAANTFSGGWNSFTGVTCTGSMSSGGSTEYAVVMQCPSSGEYKLSNGNPAFDNFSACSTTQGKSARFETNGTINYDGYGFKTLFRLYN